MTYTRVSKKYILLNSILTIVILLFSLSDIGYGQTEKIKIGVFNLKNYYEMSNEQEPMGFGFEYLNHLEKYADFKFEYVFAESSELREMLDRGEIDIIDNSIKCPELEKDYFFSLYPTGTTALSINALRSNKKFNYNELFSLNGILIGFVSEGTVEDSLMGFAKKNNLSYFSKKYNTHSELENALIANEVDAIIKESVLSEPFEKTIAIVDKDDYYFITTKDKKELMFEIDQAQILLEKNEPDLQENLYKTFFLNESLSTKFTSSEERYIDSLNRLKVVYIEDSAPFAFFNEKTNSTDGINVKIWENISKQTDIKYTLVPAETYEEAYELLDKKKADIILGLPEHTKNYTNDSIILTDSFLKVPLTIIGREHTILPNDVFAISSDCSTSVKYVKANFPNNIIKYYETVDDAFNAVKNDAADFTVDNLYSASYYLQDKAYSDLGIAVVAMVSDNFTLALANNNEYSLLGILNKAIQNFNEQDNESLFLAHTLQNSNKTEFERFLERYQVHFFLAVIIFILLFSLFLAYLLYTQMKNKKKIWELAYIDQLTGLPNFNKFKIDAQALIDAGSEIKYVLLKFDVNKFNLINETKGFAEGDRIIRTVGEIFTSTLNPKTDIISRISADNFIVLMAIDSDFSKYDMTEIYYQPFREEIFKRAGYKLQFSIGRYFLNKEDNDIKEIYEKVNSAHSLAKINSAISPVYDYDDEIKKNALRQRDIENKMEAALENNEFSIYLQPKYSLETASIVGAEALVRWNEGQKTDIVYPSEFIPLFEKNGFITKLDFYMFKKACELIQGWIEDGKEPVTVSINFSRMHLNNPNFVEEINKIANSYNVPKKFLEIELTESTMLDNEELLEDLLNKLHDSGFTLSMDDFGTGYSSLGLLKNLPVDVIKIDRSFFTNNRYKTRAKTVLKSIISMAKGLNIHTVAEGVEEQEHVDFLREIGCEQVQGYFYAKPMPARDFIHMPSEFVSKHHIMKEVISYDAIGNIKLGREELGLMVPVDVYRLFELSIRESLIQLYGEGEMEEALRLAGRIAGTAFTNKFLDVSLSFEQYVQQLTEKFVELQIGIISIESYDEKTGRIILTVAADLDCAGLEDLNKTVCLYDEGFISAVLSIYTKKHYSTTEIDCWATGAKICRFEAKPQ